MGVNPASFKRENVGVAGPAPLVHVSEPTCNTLSSTFLTYHPVAIEFLQIFLSWLSFHRELKHCFQHHLGTHLKVAVSEVSPKLVGAQGDFQDPGKHPTLHPTYYEKPLGKKQTGFGNCLGTSLHLWHLTQLVEWWHMISPVLHLSLAFH